MLENNLDKPPLFSVGEEVFLCSRDSPHLNGDSVVLGVEEGHVLGTPSWGYHLSIKHPNGCKWDQSALRKKHKPSEHSFDSLIAELKSKEPRNAKA